MESTLYTFRLAEAGNVAHRPHSTGDDDGDTTNPKVSGRSKDNLPGNPIQPTSKAADVLDQLLLDNKARVFCGTTQLAAASKLGGVVGLAPTTGSSRGRAACGNLVRRNLGTRRCPHLSPQEWIFVWLCGADDARDVSPRSSGYFSFVLTIEFRKTVVFKSTSIRSLYNHHHLDRDRMLVD